MSADEARRILPLVRECDGTGKQQRWARMVLAIIRRDCPQVLKEAQDGL